eukprot:gene409-10076_t
MSEKKLKKEQAKKDLLAIIREIARDKDDDLIFDLEKLLKRWEAAHPGKFKDFGLGHAKLTGFLRDECNVEHIDGTEYKIVQNKSKSENEALCPRPVQESQILFDSTAALEEDDVTVCEARPEDDQTTSPKPAIALNDLKHEVLTVLQNFILHGKKKRRRSFFTIEELSLAWQEKNPGPFKKYGYGHFKSFLECHCNFRRPSDCKQRDKFQISLQDVETELKNIQIFRGNVVSNASKSNKKQKKLEVNEISPVGWTGIQHGVDGSSQSPQPQAVIFQTDKVSSFTETIALPCNASNASVSAPPQEVDNACHSTKESGQNEVVDQDTQQSTVSLESTISQSEKYFFQVVTVLYKSGLEGLRRLFMKIHPTWKNSMQDIQSFNKGQLRLDSHETRKFKSGDIGSWDITLMAKVLLYSDLAVSALQNDQIDAVKKIREIKNTILSHHDSNELTKSEFEKIMKELKPAIVQVGIIEEEFETTLRNADLNKDNLYYKMFLEELRQNKKITEEISEGIHEIIRNLEKINQGVIKQSEIPEFLKKHNPNSWTQWLEIKKHLKNFDTDNNQYILVTDRIPSLDEEQAKILANVPWKLVLDLDPDSDIRGFLTQFTPGETKGGMIETYTPSNLKEVNNESLLDNKRMHWLFVNGRNLESNPASQRDLRLSNQDMPMQSIKDWKKNYKTPIEDFIKSCCKSLDSMKPTFCVVLDIQRGVSTQIAQIIVEKLDERFIYGGFAMSYLSFAPEIDIDDLPNAEFSSLPLNLFVTGVSSLLGCFDDKYQLPSSQQYNFLTEYLEIMYRGCEDIPDELSDDDKEKFKNKHLKSFLAGNVITFPSLYFRHDATRNITTEIINYIRSLQSKVSKSQIVQITHAPGSGGTTVARRVLWDLHTTVPCAVVKMEYAPESFGPDSDGEKYLISLCDRISFLEDRCRIPPVILVDGSSRVARILSDCVVRKMEGRAIILRCSNYQSGSESEDSYFQSHSQFKINPELKNDDADYSEFKQKYDDYSKRFPNNLPGAAKVSRVFHFPMMVMLGEFIKLDEIVQQSLDIVKKKSPVEYEVAILVAFLQGHSTFSTPASLLAKYFEKKSQTYEEIAGNFSANLINLMVPEKAPTKEKFIGYRDSLWDSSDDDRSVISIDDASEIDDRKQSKRIIKSYSFQHLKIANLVMKHSGRSLAEITEDFIHTKVLESYKGNKDYKYLIDNLFLYNKENSEEHFSNLVLKLDKIPNGGRILEDAAKQTKDVTFYSHVARFFAYKGKFQKARELIKEGFSAEKNAPVEKKRGVHNTEGYIVLKCMKKKKEAKIENIENLKSYAKEALDLFRKARDNPPRVYPNPLLGEVNVWQFCLEWIIKVNDSNVEQALKFILQDDFFSPSISECISLLDEVDQIVLTVPSLIDPARTRHLANDARMALTQSIGRSFNSKRKTYRAVNVQLLCKEITEKYFRSASEREIIRLRVLWLFEQTERKLYCLERLERQNLYDWLWKLVKDYNMWVHTRDLMDAAAIQPKPPFLIDDALSLVNDWQRNIPNDPLSYFFKYIFCFLLVCNGEVFDYRAIYEDAKETCSKKTHSNPRKIWQQYYLGKEGEKGSICTVLSRSVLESKYVEKDKPKNSRNDDANEHRRHEDLLDTTFWETHCRKYLLECKGRIYLSPSTPRGRRHPYIMMEPGNLKIGVPRNETGIPDLDYRPDSRVSFVVCFTLAGPKARGILFLDDSQQRGTNARYKRQGSRNEKSKN